MIRALLVAIALAGSARADIPPPGPRNDRTAAEVDTAIKSATEAAGAAEAAPVAAIDPSALIGAPAGPPLTGEALREQTHAVAKLLRCPVCQGLSVADSRAESALAMKAEVEDLVAQGYDAEQVLLYFEASYGEFIRLEPKFEGVNVLVWGAPVLLLLGGVGWVFWSVNAAGRRARTAARDAAPDEAAARAVPSTVAASGAEPGPAAAPDPALAAYLRRVREESR